MTKYLSLFFAGLVAGAVFGPAGYWVGNRQGQAARQAAFDRQAVTDLTGIIESHTALIASANDASRSMRTALQRQQTANQKTSRELRYALESTAASRSDCHFPADVLRGLQDARDSAAKAASGGVRGFVPAAPGSSQ